MRPIRRAADKDLDAWESAQKTEVAAGNTASTKHNTVRGARWVAYVLSLFGEGRAGVNQMVDM